MKKATLLVFLFLVELIFLFRPHSNPFLEDDYTFDGVVVFVVPVIIAFILSGLFFISQYKARKKITENTYDADWFIRFGLKLCLALFALNTAYAIFVCYVLCGSPECRFFSVMNIFYSLFYIPLEVLLFFFLPAVIYHKFYQNTSGLRWIFRSTLIITCVLFVIIITRFFTCGLNRDVDCIAEKALKKNNFSLCDKSWSEEDRDLCLKRVSWYSKDFSVCEAVDFEDSYNYCLENIAANTNNPELCEKIEKEEEDSEKDFEERKNDCFFEVGQKSTDDSICDKIVDDEYNFTLCIRKVGVNSKNPALCERVNQYDRENCYRYVEEYGVKKSLEK
jgi:hypothetical protein